MRKKDAKVYEKCHRKRIFVTIISNFWRMEAKDSGESKSFVLLILMMIFISRLQNVDILLVITENYSCLPSISPQKKFIQKCGMRKN